MKRRVRFPIRLKILVTLLFVVTAVVSVIVFTMANLFHEDKKTYISDLVSMTALSTAEECRSVLLGYRHRVEVYSRIMGDRDLPEKQRQVLLHELFADFPELVAIFNYRDGKESGAVLNSKDLERAGLGREALEAYRLAHPLDPALLAKGMVIVENDTLSPKLPTLGLAFATTAREGSSPDIVWATLRLDDLMRIAARSSVFEVFLTTRDGTLLAHANVAKVIGRDRMDLRPETAQLGKRGASVSVEYEQDAKTLIAGFADVGFGQLLAGARIPKTAAYLASRDLLKDLGKVALVLLAFGALVGIFWARRITWPLERLSTATQAIAQGNFDTSVQVASSDEIGELAHSFNQMATGLKEREEALQTAQSQLVQSEKMAAFGQLGAGIAHEVKNPLAGILGCAQIALKKAEAGTALHSNLQLIEKETKRCKSIIDNLLRFARQEKAAMGPTQVNTVVEDAVAIVSHQLEMNNVRLETDLAQSLPQILGNANQLQQVLMNLMMNAQQAMDGAPGQVTVTTRKAPAGSVEVLVRDTGPGIPKEILDKVFEPFFTTKPSGKGTGLGLSVSFGIIKDHNGEITVESVPGRGATFIIALPTHEMQPAHELAGSVA